MEIYQKKPKTQTPMPLPANPTGSGGPSLQELQVAGQQFLKAGNDAINRALSKGQSEDFLAANRQSGGQ